MIIHMPKGRYKLERLTAPSAGVDVEKLEG